MNRLLDETEDQQDRSSRNANQGADREITLGTTMILLIFFALAVYGAVLFGFGYSLGSKHTDSPPNTVAAAPTSSGSFSNFNKPAAGSPVGAVSAVKPPAAAPADAATLPMPTPVPIKAEPAEPKVIASVSDFEDPAAKSKTPSTAPIPSSPSAIPIAANGTVVVQVAAVSHQEDADLIASTLKRRGYVVNVRTEADKLMHVQVGPFANRKDAEAMKAKLLADGFNAYIK